MAAPTKSLIAFFSRKGNNYVGGRIVNLAVGNTEVAAETIQKLTGGDLFRIDAVKPYPSDYEETTEVARQELRQNARPELSGRVGDMGDYGVIFLGYPNWWGTMPMAVYTFLEAYDFAGKTILPFCTHEGSGMGHSESEIRKLCPGATVLEGLAITGGSVHRAGDQIAAWLRASGMMASVTRARACRDCARDLETESPVTAREVCLITSTCPGPTEQSPPCAGAMQAALPSRRPLG
jgi:flavodoxin